MKVLFTSGSWPDSDPGNLIYFRGLHTYTCYCRSYSRLAFNPSLAGIKMNQACKRGYLYLRSHYPLNFTSIFMNLIWLIVLGFNDTSTLEGHFVSSPREREKRDRRESRGDERGTGKKEEQEWKWRNRRNKNIPPLPLPTTRIAGLAQL